jgi:acetyl esterase/lipase
VFLMGHSAGAQIAMLLALDEHYLSGVGLSHDVVRGVIGLSGPYDFTPGEESRVVFRMSPGDAADPAIEPIHFAAAAAHGPPLLLIHGGRDAVVRYDNTVKLARAVQDAGGDARAVVFPGLDHPGVALALASSFHWLAPVFRDVLEFIEKH